MGAATEGIANVIAIVKEAPGRRSNACPDKGSGGKYHDLGFPPLVGRNTQSRFHLTPHDHRKPKEARGAH